MITRNKRTPVQSSSKDAISSWLDVLTSMLSLPETKRLQVRDELEDHLRSRVDDLLISGLDEHEAVRQAVSELGETAELAKVVTNAHTRPTQRRRTMQSILIAGALAGMSVGGYSLLTTTSASNLPGITAGVVFPENTEESVPDVRQVQINSMPTLMAFDQIASTFGYNVDIHTLDTGMVSHLQNREISLDGEFALDRAIQSMLMQSLQYAAELTTEIHGDTVELLTHEEQARRSVITRVFRLESANKDAINDAQRSLVNILDASVDTRWLSISVVGNGVVIAAPPAVLVRVEQSWALIQELHTKSIIEDRIQREEDKASMRKLHDLETHQRLEREQKQEAARQHAIEEIKAEFQRVQRLMLTIEDKYLVVSQQKNNLGIWTNKNRAIEISKEEFDEQFRALEQLSREFVLNLEEAKARYEYLNDTLIKAEYRILFENLH